MDSETNEVYPLDDATLEIVQHIDATITMLNQQLNGALMLFIRQQKLKGNWRLAANRRELALIPVEVKK
jgi:hypothetical protein